MQLPQKTFLTQNYSLSESDFECNRQAKPLRIMQLLQDIATIHGEQIGVGWNVMNENGMLWILSKIKLEFHQPVTPQNADFTLYTWPLAPSRFYAERCFVATRENVQLFSATSLWSIISKDRKILPAETMNRFFRGEYCDVHCDTTADFAKVRFDDSYRLAYETTVFRSDLDHNGHVNNTNYITYAINVLPPEEKVSAAEIVFHKELNLAEKLQVFCKREENKISVVGRRGEETCFTAVLTVTK